MELTTEEALNLLRAIGQRTNELARQADLARADRNWLIRIFDGQQGMARQQMADACGITRMALWKILDRDVESVEEDVLMSDDLRRALEQALDVEVPEGRLRLDVHA